MDPDSLAQIVFLAILLMGSAFFSASETALMSLSKIRVRHMVDEQVRGAKVVSKLLEKPNELLSAILIGNNLVNIAASSITTALAISYFGGTGVAYATAITTVLVLIFGEVVPKAIAANDSEGVSIKVSPLIRLIARILTPLTFLLSRVSRLVIRMVSGQDASDKPLITEAELRTVVEVSQEEGIIQNEERDLINNVFGFSGRRVEDIMTSRPDISAIDSKWTYNQVVQFFKTENYSRAPVYEENMDNIVGVIHIKDFLGSDTSENFSIRDHMLPPLFSFEFVEAGQLMQQMRKQKVTMAVILDEYGGTAGIITMEDLLEEIVGEIMDEHDDGEQAPVRVIKEDEFLISGTARIEEVNELTGTHFESEDYGTMAGYMLSLLGRIPEVGEKLESEGVRFVVEEVDKNRISVIRMYT